MEKCRVINFFCYLIIILFKLSNKNTITLLIAFRVLHQKTNQLLFSFLIHLFKK